MTDQTEGLASREAMTGAVAARLELESTGTEGVILTIDQIEQPVEYLLQQWSDLSLRERVEAFESAASASGG